MIDAGRFMLWSINAAVVAVGGNAAARKNCDVAAGGDDDGSLIPSVY